MLFSAEKQIHKRKEVNIMKYEKPELVVLGSASTAIEALMKGQGVADAEEIRSTPAYQADE